MISEEQRRALHALREALRLCEGAGLSVEAGGDYSYCCKIRDWDVTGNPGLLSHSSFSETLEASDIDRLLAEHPEP